MKWDNLWRTLWNTFSIFIFKLPSIHPHLIIIINAQPASKALTFDFHNDILTTLCFDSTKNLLQFCFVFDSLVSSKCVLVQRIDFNLRFYLRWTIIINFWILPLNTLYRTLYIQGTETERGWILFRLSVRFSRTDLNLKSSKVKKHLRWTNNNNNNKAQNKVFAVWIICGERGSISSLQFHWKIYKHKRSYK